MQAALGLTFTGLVLLGGAFAWWAVDQRRCPPPGGRAGGQPGPRGPAVAAFGQARGGAHPALWAAVRCRGPPGPRAGRRRAGRGPRPRRGDARRHRPSSRRNAAWWPASRPTPASATRSPGRIMPEPTHGTARRSATTGSTSGMAPGSRRRPAPQARGRLCRRTRLRPRLLGLRP